MVSPRDVTALFGDWSRGNRTALNQLLPLVYAELRHVAARQLRSERADHTLQPTALVHEVFIRLVDQRQVDWQNRAHFFGVAANVMRRILVDHARRHRASKRGEGVRCLSLEEASDVAASNEMPVLALDHALNRLETIDPELAKIVELRAFGGLTIEETVHVLSVSGRSGCLLIQHLYLSCRKEATVDRMFRQNSGVDVSSSPVGVKPGEVGLD